VYLARMECCLRRCCLLLLFLMVAGGQLRPLEAQTSAGAAGASGTAATVPDSVTGRVLNAATGTPVPRALVRLNDRAVLTDHEGKFRFEQNTESAANILITKPGFYASADPSEAGNLFLQAMQLAVPLELRIYPEALLTGRVLGPDGTPLQQILVSAMRSAFDESGHHWSTTAQSQTDVHGNFRLPVPGGSYRIESHYTPQDGATGEAVLPVVVPEGSSPSTSQVIQIRGGEEQHFELRPAVSHIHTVTLTTQGSSGRGFVRITAHTRSGSSLLQANPRTDGASGAMTMELPQGSYVLTARMNNGESSAEAETTVTVPDHDVSGVVLQFAPIPSIPIELLVDSESAAINNPPQLQQLGLTLQTEEVDIERGDSTIRPSMVRDHSYAFTVPTGNYRLQARMSGSWYIKSVNYGDSDLLQQELVVAPGAAGAPIRVTVSDQTGSLQGAVLVNGSSGACWIYLIPSGPSAQSVFSLRSGVDGSFSSAHLPPGSYQALASERRLSANFRDPTSLAPYSSYVHTVTIEAGDKSTLNLDAAPALAVMP
jgi:hypothetical protein